MHVDHSKSQPTDDKLSLKGAPSLSRNLFNFWTISDNISKTVQDTQVAGRVSNATCALLNGYVADDDVALKTTLISTF